MTQITVNVIDPSSPAEVKYDIFRRINTGGKPLNSQEIRNCLASKNLRLILRDMINLESFKTATGGSVKDTRMEAQELALRFICFLKLYEKDSDLNNYNGKIETALDLLVDDLNRTKKEDLEIFISLFDNAMRNSYYLFGRYAFRKCKIEHLQPEANRQLINKALFVSWSVLLSKYDPNLILTNNRSESLALPLAEKISTDSDFFLYLTYSTNSKANMQAAFKEAELLISKNLI